MTIKIHSADVDWASAIRCTEQFKISDDLFPSWFSGVFQLCELKSHKLILVSYRSFLSKMKHIPSNKKKH